MTHTLIKRKHHKLPARTIRINRKMLYNSHYITRLPYEKNSNKPGVLYLISKLRGKDSQVLH